jgi:hypothetical protein
LILGVIAGIFLAAIIIFFPFTGFTSEQIDFVKTPEFLTWFALVCAQVILLCLFINPIRRTIKELRHHIAGNKIKITQYLVFVFFLLIFSSIMTRIFIPTIADLPLPDLRLKLNIITLITIIAVLPTALGIFLVRIGFKNMLDEGHRDQDYIIEYLKYRGYLQKLLWIIGTLLSLIIITGGALRNIHITMEKPFDELFVLIYAGYLTMIVVIVYLPAHFILINNAKRILDTYLPLPSVNSDSWLNIYQKRKNLGDMLHVRLSARENLNSMIATFTPLISGIMATLLTGFKV